MRKTTLKILGTIFTAGACFIAQRHIRQHFDIDPRIWFFVVYAMFVVGFIAVMFIFKTEINHLEKYIQTHTFADFADDAHKKARTTTKKLKNITETIVNSQVYGILSLIIPVAAMTGIMYNASFHEDFVARSMAYIVCLILTGLTVIIKLLNVAHVDGSRRTYEFISGGIWIFVFITSLTGFLG